VVQIHYLQQYGEIEKVIFHPHLPRWQHQRKQFFDVLKDDIEKRENNKRALLECILYSDIQKTFKSRIRK
jgi:hypothetical protein